MGIINVHDRPLSWQEKGGNGGGGGINKFNTIVRLICLGQQTF